MTNITATLKKLGMTVDDSFLNQFILNLLPFEYETFQIYYNTIKDKWNVNKPIGKFIQEENRIKNMRNHTINFAV